MRATWDEYGEVMRERHVDTEAKDVKLRELGLRLPMTFTYHRTDEGGWGGLFATRHRRQKILPIPTLPGWSSDPLAIRPHFRGGEQQVSSIGWHNWLPASVCCTTISQGVVSFFFLLGQKCGLVSLYPAVQYGVNGETWPIGHPDIYIGTEVEDLG